MFFWQLFKYLIVRPFSLLKESLTDPDTGLTSITKIAFLVALVVVTVIIYKLSAAVIALATSVQLLTPSGAIALQSLLSFLRDLLYIYIGAFAATHLGAKMVSAWSNSKSSITSNVDVSYPPQTDEMAAAKKTHEFDDLEE